MFYFKYPLQDKSILANRFVFCKYNRGLLTAFIRAFAVLNNQKQGISAIKTSLSNVSR